MQLIREVTDKYIYNGHVSVRTFMCQTVGLQKRLTTRPHYLLNRGSNMSAHVLLNLLSDLLKR